MENGNFLEPEITFFVIEITKTWLLANECLYFSSKCQVSKCVSDSNFIDDFYELSKTYFIVFKVQTRFDFL